MKALITHSTQRTINNVTAFTEMEDGRTLIYYNKKCPCCKNTTSHTAQVPAHYTIEFIIESDDYLMLAPIS